MKKMFLSLCRDASGQVALECVVVASLVSLAVITGSLLIGGTLTETLAAIAPHL